MSNKIIKILVIALLAAVFSGIFFGGCGILGTSASAEAAASSEDDADEVLQGYENGIIDTEDMFTKRDLKQTADLSDAIYYTLADNEDIQISEAGVYVISGTASESTVMVEAPDDAKVQIVLDGVSITNSDFPCIYIRTADKVFVTVEADSSLSVTGSFVSDGDIKTDGVIFSRSDLVLNGTAELTLSSSAHGIVGKDDLKITGGTYAITAASHGIEANDSIRIADGTLIIKAEKDALHAENDDDDTLGYVYICGGSLSISAGDDGIHAISCIQIDDGSMEISAAEGVEATRIQINSGSLNIKASDDGINAARKSSSMSPCVEINGGEINITMGAGDTDGIDSNGDIIINGGTVNITGSSTFDYVGSGTINGGTVYCNGQQVSTLPNQMMGGMGQNGPGGGWGGHGGRNGQSGEWGGQNGGQNGESNGPGGFPGQRPKNGGERPEGDPPEGGFPEGGFPEGGLPEGDFPKGEFPEEGFSGDGSQI